ncbi:22833_t:CDS:2, partial [Dentiscutata erythropus]
KRQNNKKSANERIKNYNEEGKEGEEDGKNGEDGEDDIGEYEQCLEELEEDNTDILFNCSASKTSALPLRRQNRTGNQIAVISIDDDEHRLENNYEESDNYSNPSKAVAINKTSYIEKILPAKNSASKVSHANTYTLRMITMDPHVATETSTAMPVCRNETSYTTAVASAAIPTDINEDQITKFSISNEFDIALWVANYPRILNLAMIIQRAQVMNTDDSSKTSLDNDNMLNNIQSNISISEIGHYKKINLQNECKALFLRTRNNTYELYEELITRVCEIPKTNVRMKTLIKDVGTWYDSYRCNFHCSILGLANQYSQIHEGEELVDSELAEFCTDMVEMAKDPEIFTKLGIFAYQALKAVLIAGNNYQSTSAAIKTCDEYTVDLKSQLDLAS